RLGQLAREAQIQFVSGAPTIILNGEDVTEAIRVPEVSDAASKVAQIPAVRRALVEKQREIGESASCVVEGRDIGSVVFPNASVKVFLDAAPGVRADRRAREADLPLEVVTGQIAERDARDRSRSESPLVQAPDAIYLDTSGMS